ncbi:MAG: ABC transporter permease subunit [Phycisphaerae bacterium]|nr:ABC transporter permease subunit [Phycisphaerae bacterium]
MNLKTVYTILRKELLETLRDKRTLIAMIGIPVILYPLLFLVSTQVIMIQQGRIDERDSRIVLTGKPSEQLNQWLEKIEKVKIIQSENPTGDLLAGDIHAMVSTAENPADILAQLGTAEVKIEYDSTAPDSNKARQRINKALKEESKKILQTRLETAGLKEEFTKPLAIQNENLAPPQKQTGSLLGTILPMIMIIMLGTGAFYPAIDVTAGEKERGTFETLLSTPTAKSEIVCGKFLTVFILSLITGLLSLGSMVLCLMFQLSQMAGAAGDAQFNLAAFQLSAANILTIFIILIPLAFFICSVMMSIALFARNFKEAQNYVTPFFMVIILPGVAAGLPGMELTRTTMFIPITNVALLFKELLMGTASPEAIVSVFITTAVYAMMALTIAVWIFQKEDIILSEEKGLPITLNRSAFIPRPTPTPGMAIMFFAMAFLLLFYVGTYVQTRNIITGSFITQWGLFFLPILTLLWFTKIDIKKTLSLKTPRTTALIATILMAAAMLVLGHQYTTWQGNFIKPPQEYAEMMKTLFENTTPAKLIVLLLAIALSPAVCEEVLFRGVILSGLRSRCSVKLSIIATGILFGLMHIYISQIIPTALLGIVITYLVLRSGSIFTGILFHLLNNSIAVLFATGYFPKTIFTFVENYEQTYFPTWLTLTALLLLTTGIALLELTKQKNDFPIQG